MLRYVLTAAGAIAMISNVAFAEMGDGATTKVITRSAEPGRAWKKGIIHRHDDGFVPSKKVVIHRHDDRYGAMVTSKKIVRHHNRSRSSLRGRQVVQERPNLH